MTPERAREIQHAGRAASAALAKTSPAYHEARRSYQTISLFAPAKVMEPLNDAWIPTVHLYQAIHQVAMEEPAPLPMPEYPHQAMHRYQNAVRRDLGMRKLKLFDHPDPPERPAQAPSASLDGH